MHLAIFAIVLAMAVSTVAIIKLDRKTNGTMIPLTKRSPWLKHDNTVDFGALDLHACSVDAKILRGFQNYEKNTGMPHSLAVNDFKKRAVGAAPLTSHQYYLWYCTITVGTPPKSFIVQLDTGSSDLFLAGPTCSGCSEQTRWDPASSSTARAKGSTFNIEFVDGSASLGNQYTDTVTIAGLTANIQTIAATTYTKMEFPPDGILGMAFESLSEYPASPIFETLVDEGRLTEPVFSIELTSEGGELYIGGTNSDLYAGNIFYTPVIEEGFWQLNIQKIRGISNHQTILRNIAAIIDTGANMIIGDQSQVANMHQRLGGKIIGRGYYSLANMHQRLGGKIIGRGYYSYPCNNVPSISFSFGSGMTVQIPGWILNQGQVTTDSSDCFSGIIGRGNRAHWTLGTVFLESVYTVFDFGNKRVGFANLP